MVKLGVCPICGFDRMIVVCNDDCRFDACPKCGFGHGYTSKRAGRKRLRNKELWDRIAIDQALISLNGEEPTRDNVLNAVSAFDAAEVAKQRQRIGRVSAFKYSDKQIVDNSLKLGVNSRQAIEAGIRLGIIPVDEEVTLLNKKPR